MGDSLRAHEAAGDYEALAEARAFARRLTGDLQAVSHDKHLRVWHGDEGMARMRRLRDDPRHGMGRVERLEGNVGYVEITSFAGEDPAAVEAAEDALASMADADALILDVRANGGGSPRMVALVSSYLFDKPTHLNSLYWRERDRTDESWTERFVRGRRYGEGKPVFVLTSARTFSAAEEFTYNLKNLKRASIVGETTGGGANPGAVMPLAANFSMFVPTGRAVSPVTGTNWEGVGVAPDVAVPAGQALERAVELARGKLKAS
jgi:C-terminal processing protease CtpA/Prc